MFDGAYIPETDLDWQASLQLMSNKESITRELATILYNSLLEFKTQLQTAFAKNDKQTLQIIAHKLHGGLCYMTTPRLKYLISQLEYACKQNPESIAAIMPHISPSIDTLYNALKPFINSLPY